ncbi:hypothetical protein GGF46_003157 [Coemansia sp. RSA 552]|nr:hypothetical protein GGF46_003157 [Coemansia sp. RSA 552]
MVRVLYFASARDAAGKDSDVVSAPKEGGMRLGELLDHIGQLNPGLAGLAGNYMISINDEYSSQDPDIVVNDTDEVGLIPPVSGG